MSRFDPNAGGYFGRAIGSPEHIKTHPNTVTTEQLRTRLETCVENGWGRAAHALRRELTHRTNMEEVA